MLLRKDTRPNPALRKNTNVDIAGDEYYPAYTLADYGLERAGRGGEVATTSQGPTAREESKGKDGRMKVASAGMIIIGDEILNGFTTASNMQITSSALGSVGVPLRRVVVVSDDEEEIAAEVISTPLITQCTCALCHACSLSCRFAACRKSST